jgi:2-haloacid dehalogenase
MHLEDFEALSFDCYGTLIDWESGLSAILIPWAARHGLTLGADELLERYATAEAYEERETPGALYPEILAASMRRLGDAVGIEVLGSESEALATSVPDWPAFPDSAAALAALSSLYKLIILSNVDRASFAGSNARLGVRFDAIVTAQDVGSYKPSTRNFDALITTARGLGIGEGRLLHVAQSLHHDHIPAKARGLPTVWIDRRGQRSGWGATPPPEITVTPDWIFQSMAELAAACVEANGG